MRCCSTSSRIRSGRATSGKRPRRWRKSNASTPSRATLKGLLKKAGLTPRDILRKRGTPYEELGLGNPALGDEAILDAIEKHPILIERPILVTDKGVRLCRPMERMNEIV